MSRASCRSRSRGSSAANASAPRRGSAGRCRQTSARRRAASVPDDFYDKIKARLYRRIGEEISGAQRVVDIGCGGCELARFLAEACEHNVTGVDIKDGAFPDHDGLPKHVRQRLRCIKADGQSLDFLEDGTVDAITAVWAVHEMAEPGAVLAEARRVLRPGGELVIVDFPRDSLAQRLWHEHYYDPREMGRMLERTGFDDVSSRLIEREQVIWAKGFRPSQKEAVG